MGLFRLLRHPALLGEILIRDLLPWYFLYEPWRFIRNYWGYARALNQILSITYLLRTLLSPWKSITDAYPTNLILIGKILETLTLNVTTRVIGCVIRSFTIVLAMLLHALLLAAFAVFLTAWLNYPFLFYSVVTYLLSR